MDLMTAKRLRVKAEYGPISRKTLRSLLKKELMTNFGFENMAAIADLLIDRFLGIIEHTLSINSKLKPLTTIIYGYDKHKKFTYGQTPDYLPLKPA
jgi:hypothetical protein